MQQPQLAQPAYAGQPAQPAMPAANNVPYGAPAAAPAPYGAPAAPATPYGAPAQPAQPGAQPSPLDPASPGYSLHDNEALRKQELARQQREKDYAYQQWQQGQQPQQPGPQGGTFDQHGGMYLDQEKVGHVRGLVQYAQQLESQVEQLRLIAESKMGQPGAPAPTGQPTGQPQPVVQPGQQPGVQPGQQPGSPGGLLHAENAKQLVTEAVSEVIGREREVNRIESYKSEWNEYLDENFDYNGHPDVVKRNIHTLAKVYKDQGMDWDRAYGVAVAGQVRPKQRATPQQQQYMQPQGQPAPQGYQPQPYRQPVVNPQTGQPVAQPQGAPAGGYNPYGQPQGYQAPPQGAPPAGYQPNPYQQPAGYQQPQQPQGYPQQGFQQPNPYQQPGQYPGGYTYGAPDSTGQMAQNPSGPSALGLAQQEVARLKQLVDKNHSPEDRIAWIRAKQNARLMERNPSGILARN